MEIQLHGRLVTCTPEEYKRLIELNLIEVPIVMSSNTTVDFKPNNSTLQQKD